MVLTIGSAVAMAERMNIRKTGARNGYVEMNMARRNCYSVDAR